LNANVVKFSPKPQKRAGRVPSHTKQFWGAIAKFLGNWTTANQKWKICWIFKNKKWNSLWYAQNLGF